MNLSGKAVRYWMDAEKIPLERVVVITDDLICLSERCGFGPKAATGAQRPKGHPTGAGNNEVPSAAVWDWGGFGKGQQVDYVLGKWSAKSKSAWKSA